MSQLLLHGSALYNGHLRGTFTLTDVAERLGVEPSLPVLSVPTGDRTPIFRMRGELSTTAAVQTLSGKGRLHRMIYQ